MLVVSSVAMVAATVGLVARGEGAQPTQLDLRTGGAWVASSSVGLLTLIDGTSAEVSARVKVGDPTKSLVATQAGPVGYAVDGERGTVARVDPRTFVSGKRITVVDNASGDVFAQATSDVVYVLDAARGRLATADADDLQPAGRGIESMAEQVGSSVVDAHGTLWLLGQSSGDLVWFNGSGRQERSGVVDSPDEAELVMVDGAAAVVDRAERRVHRINASGRLTRDACLETDPTDQTLRFGGSPHADRVYVVSGDQGMLRVSDLRSGDCADIAIPVADAGDELGDPLESAGRVFVPNYTTGSVAVVDVATENVLKTQELGASGGFDLFAEDGIVFYNDPETEKAGVIHLDGTFTAVAKYNPDDPGEGVEPLNGRDTTPKEDVTADKPPDDDVDQADESPDDQQTPDDTSTRPPRPDERNRPPGPPDTSPTTRRGGPPTNPGPCNSDGDNDGVPDCRDQCPGQDDSVDTDGDGVPDGCDTDADNDGVPDAQDQCPGSDDRVDSDGDGVPDGCDTDADNDGVPDAQDQCPGQDDRVDVDNDKVPDCNDPEIAFPYGLQPGQSTGLSGTTAASDSRLPALNQLDDLVPFTITAGGTTVFSASVQNRVSRSDTLGTMIFGPRIRDVQDTGSGYVVTRVTLNGYGGVATDVNYRTDGTGDVGPTGAARSGSGSALTFDYGTPIAPPQESLFLSIVTNATTFAASGGSMTISARGPGGDTVSTTVAVAAPIAP